MKGALARYRVMAYVVGVGLLVLVVIGVPLQYAAHRPEVVSVVGPIHGVLYMIYLVTAYDLARRAHFRPARLLGMICAGLLPGLAFVIEHRVSAQMAAEMAAGTAEPLPADLSVRAAGEGPGERERDAEERRTPGAGR